MSTLLSPSLVRSWRSRLAQLATVDRGVREPGKGILLLADACEHGLINTIGHNLFYSECHHDRFAEFQRLFRSFSMKPCIVHTAECEPSYSKFHSPAGLSPTEAPLSNERHAMSSEDVYALNAAAESLSVSSLPRRNPPPPTTHVSFPIGRVLVTSWGLEFDGRDQGCEGLVSLAVLARAARRVAHSTACLPALHLPTIVLPTQTRP